MTGSFLSSRAKIIVADFTKVGKLDVIGIFSHPFQELVYFSHVYIVSIVILSVKWKRKKSCESGGLFQC